MLRGRQIDLEVWAMPQFFIAGIPAPLCLGQIHLEGGVSVTGLPANRVPPQPLLPHSLLWRLENLSGQRTVIERSGEQSHGLHRGETSACPVMLL